MILTAHLKCGPICCPHSMGRVWPYHIENFVCESQNQARLVGLHLFRTSSPRSSAMSVAPPGIDSLPGVVDRVVVRRQVGRLVFPLEVLLCESRIRLFTPSGCSREWRTLADPTPSARRSLALSWTAPGSWRTLLRPSKVLCVCCKCLWLKQGKKLCARLSVTPASAG